MIDFLPLARQCDKYICNLTFYLSKNKFTLQFNYDFENRSLVQNFVRRHRKQNTQYVPGSARKMLMVIPTPALDGARYCISTYAREAYGPTRLNTAAN